jgi:hypothetical protein
LFLVLIDQPCLVRQIGRDHGGATADMPLEGLLTFRHIWLRDDNERWRLAAETTSLSQRVQFHYFLVHERFSCCTKSHGRNPFLTDSRIPQDPEGKP